MIFGGMLVVGGWQQDHPPQILLRDQATVAGVNPLTGAVSTLGAVALIVAGSICVYSTRLRRLKALPGPPRGYFLALGLGTLWLGLDDLFLVHEALAPRYLGVQEKPLFAGYGALALVWLGCYRRHVGLGGWLALGITVLGWGTSLGFDLVWTQSAGTNLHAIVEDGAKVVGIASWFAYCLTASLAFPVTS